ncbi:6-hydroxymethylpterin diphosphokinase MptE-like protein [Mucilaginibacter sp.]|uniref:6-hydroxymethylpterin diphosphokinase MptE-like protein n=1 Tax=Mucilaginibacter sp. TaxID=1882438 RepID=UPI002ED69A85
MKKVLRKILHPLLFLVVDKRTYRGLANISLLKLIAYNVRFKLASKGIYLTKNEKLFSSLKDKYKGERCFIIGNGPSLNNIDLTKLKDEYTFGVNAIYLNYEKMNFHPTFYVLEDYAVAEDRADEINNYNEAEYKFIGYFLNYVIKDTPKRITTNVYISAYEELFTPTFSENCLEGIGVGGTVSFQCMQLAFYLGFSKVYLVGFDHNYAIPKEANLERSSVILSESDDENHFSKEYFGKGYRWHDPKVDRMEKSYEEAKAHFDAADRKINNATAGGKLEVFERVDYNSLFN